MDRRERLTKNDDCDHDMDGRMAGLAIFAAFTGLVWLVVGICIGRFF